MALALDSEIMLWIGEEHRGCSGGSRMPVVPVQLLIIRLVLSHRDSGSLTKSTELSISAFDRANLYRVLRVLHRKGLIEFVDLDGVELKTEELNQMIEQVDQERALGHITLTERGNLELSRLRRLYPGS
jgi:hypothetical protein